MHTLLHHRGINLNDMQIANILIWAQRKSGVNSHVLNITYLPPKLSIQRVLDREKLGHQRKHIPISKLTYGKQLHVEGNGFQRTFFIHRHTDLI